MKMSLHLPKMMMMMMMKMMIMMIMVVVVAICRLSPPTQAVLWIPRMNKVC